MEDDRFAERVWLAHLCPTGGYTGSEGNRFTRECSMLMHTQQVGIQGMVALWKVIDSLESVACSSIPNRWVHRAWGLCGKQLIH